MERIARWSVRPLLELPAPAARRALDALATVGGSVPGVPAEPWRSGSLRGELLTPDGVSGPPRILYLHGGAYRVGSPRSHRGIAAAIAAHAGTPACVLDYRLAPEHPAPAAFDDVVEACVALTERAQAPPALAGDSAGSGLALACAVAARDAGAPRPPGLALISPWVDMTLSGPSVSVNDRRDAMLSRAALDRGAAAYAGTVGRGDPRCSPLFAELTGLPPMLIQVGSAEVLLSDAEALAERAGAAGVEVELEVGEGLWHDYQGFAGFLREGREALERMGRWVGARLAG